MNDYSPPDPGEPLLRIGDITALTGFHRATIYRMIDEQRFPAPLPVGGSSRWPRSAYDKWLEELKASRPAAPAPTRRKKPRPG